MAATPDWAEYVHPQSGVGVLAANMAPEMFPIAMDRLDTIGYNHGANQASFNTPELQRAAGRTLVDERTDPRTGIITQVWAEPVQDSELALEEERLGTTRTRAHPRFRELNGGAYTNEPIHQPSDVYAEANPLTGVGFVDDYAEALRQRTRNRERSSGLIAGDNRVPEVQDAAIDPDIRVIPFLSARHHVNHQSRDLSRAQVDAAVSSGRATITGDNVLPPVVGHFSAISSRNVDMTTRYANVLDDASRGGALPGASAAAAAGGRPGFEPVGVAVTGGANTSMGTGTQTGGAVRFAPARGLTTQVMPPVVAPVSVSGAAAQTTTAGIQAQNVGRVVPAITANPTPVLPPRADPRASTVRPSARNNRRGISAMGTLSAVVDQRPTASNRITTQVQARNFVAPVAGRRGDMAVPQHGPQANRVQRGMQALGDAASDLYRVALGGTHEANGAVTARSAVHGRSNGVALGGSGMAAATDRSAQQLRGNHTDAVRGRDNALAPAGASYMQSFEARRNTNHRSFPGMVAY